MGDRGDLRETRLYLGWQVVSLRYDALRIPPRIVVCQQSASERTGGAGASIMLQMAPSGAPLCFANPSPPSGWIGDSHSPAIEHAGHTTKSLPRYPLRGRVTRGGVGAIESW